GCHQVVFCPAPQTPGGTSDVCVRQRLFELMMLFPPIPFAPAPLNVISQKCGAIGWPAAVQLEFGTPGPVQYGASVEVFMSDELLLIRFMSAQLRMEIPSPLLPMTVLLVTSFLLATPISDNPPSIWSVPSISGPGVLLVVLQ